MKKLKIDMSELELAFTVSEMSDASHLLDTETGNIVMITEDDSSAIEDFFEEVDAEEDENELAAKFEAWLEDYDCPDWQVDSIRDAFNAERESGGRYIEVPRQDSRSGYDDMVDFAEAVTDDRLRELLAVALNGKGAFRRFKDVLYSYPEQQESYYKFSNERLRQRILEWLEDEGIELEA